LANSKSAIKRHRQSEQRRLRNRSVRSIARTVITRARTAIEHGAPSSEEEVRLAQRTLDISVRKGVIHPNNAARRKSRLMKKLNAARNAGQAS
jgi:small subunit ribosomal protein S20